MTDTNSPAAGGLSKTVAFAIIGIIAALGLIGAVMLYIFRPDASAAFIQNLITVLGLVVTAAGTLYGLGKVSERVEVVQRQTNGTLSALREENDRLTRENVELAKQVPTP